MNNKILTIAFIEASRKIIFHLSTISNYSIDVGGIPWEETYLVELNSEFHKFWEYVLTKYGTSANNLFAPTEAILHQKTRGANNNGYPWIHTLIVKQKDYSESIEFYPHTCDLQENIEKEELEEKQQRKRYLSELTSIIEEVEEYG